MEAYVGKHRKPELDDATYYMDPDTGFRTMVWSANHTSQYPIVQHVAMKHKKYKPKHGYNSTIEWFKLKLGLDGFGRLNPATNYM